MKSALTKVLAIIVLLALVFTPVLAIDTLQTGGPGREPDRSGFVPEDTSFTKQHFTAVEPESVISLERSERYVILFEEPSLAVVSKDAAQLDTTSPQSLSYLEKLAKQRSQVMAAVESTLGRNVTIKHVYDVILNGVSVEMSPEEAQQLAKVSGIRQILPVTLEQPDTDAGPIWIGAGGVWDGSADPADLGSLGEGMLVGIIDTGINFDHPSFSDTPEDEFVYTWTGDYLGVCNPTTGDPAYVAACNDKLVGAYGYTGETVSPEDSDGHGSHTASTVAGNYVTFEFMGVETTISGVVPHAQIISFDVCDPSGCWGDDSAAAVEQAIIDGVDALNYSISGGKSPYSDVVELAFLEAFGEDIFVAASGGNLREEPSTDGQVNHLSPWVTTVAASSHNRKFTNDIDVVSPVGSPWVDMAIIQSTSPVPFPALDDVELKWAGDDTASTSVNYPDNREGCSAFPAGFFYGKVALIQRGICTFADKVNNAQAAGAIGMLAYADSRPPLSMGGLDTATLPAAMLYLSSADSAAFADYVGANAPVLLDISALGRYLNDSWGDIKADFSFRGPSANNLQVLKPDITAPGLEVLAAVADGVIDSDGAVQAALYQGTSMSSPHTAGAGALLSAVFPDWSVAQVKSALMLTAERDNLIKEDMQTPADLFDFGAGRVDLEMASLTGLTMDETYENMVAANPGEGGDMKTLNIASLYNSLCVGECSWTRTFTSVADVSAEYTVTAPAWVTVEPASFTIATGGTQTITVTADVSGLTEDEWAFATILFETTATHPGGKAISDAAIPMAVLPVGSNIPDFVSFETHRDADMGTIPDLLAGEITAGTAYQSGLVKGTLEEVQLDPDPTNGDPVDDLSQVFVKRIDVPAYSIRLVAEITETTASDIDMFLFYDYDGSGDLSTPDLDWLVAQSATSAALEYINAPKDWIFWNADDVYFLVVQNWAGTAGDTFTLATGIVPLSPEVGNYDVIVPVTNPAATPFELDVYWDEDTEEGDRLYGYFDTCADAACDEWIGATDIDIRRLADDVVKTADVETAMPGDMITYTIEITNFADVATDYSINDVLPAGVTYVPDSVTGGAVYDEITNAITWSGTVDAPGEPYYNVTDSLTDPYCDTGFGGYADLETFGILPQSSISGDTKAWGVGAGSIPFNFYGVDYNAMYFTDDGFAIFDPVNTWVPAPMPWVNQDIPDTELPNALAAILWQDMEVVYDPNPTLLRGVSIATAGANYHVIEYDDVQPYGASSITYDFEIVYQHSVVDTPGWYEIVFAYDNINGPLNYATIGLENYAGTAAAQYAYMDANFVNGHMICFDLVTPSTTHVITFQVTVDEGMYDFLLENEVEHDNDSLGTLPELASALVTVLPNAAPVAVADAYTTAEDTELIVAVADGVLANDTDIEVLTAELVLDAANGTLALAGDGSFTYLPDLDFNGEDSFTYKAFDGELYSETVTVTITVTPVNDAPEAVDDEYTVIEDGLLEVAAPGVLANDIEVDLDNMVVSLVTNVEHGTLILLGDGSFTYQPDKGFSGIDTFEYQLITYPNAIQSEWTDEAIVTITVTPLLRIYLPLIFK
jgi:conserved repeat domain